jgi:hypothetical protein
MKNAQIKTAFDLRTYLASSGLGRTIVDVNRGRVIFSQGDAAALVYYMRSGTIKLTTTPFPSTASKPSSRF